MHCTVRAHTHEQTDMNPDLSLAAYASSHPLCRKQKQGGHEHGGLEADVRLRGGGGCSWRRRRREQQLPLKSCSTAAPVKREKLNESIAARLICICILLSSWPPPSRARCRRTKTARKSLNIHKCRGSLPHKSLGRMLLLNWEEVICQKSLNSVFR